MTTQHKLLSFLFIALAALMGIGQIVSPIQTSPYIVSFGPASLDQPLQFVAARTPVP